MKPGNAAAYECKKGKQGLHHWTLSVWGVATCKKCKLVLSKEDTADLLATRRD